MLHNNRYFYFVYIYVLLNELYIEKYNDQCRI